MAPVPTLLLTAISSQLCLSLKGLQTGEYSKLLLRWLKQCWVFPFGNAWAVAI